jgi:hypothetical protein
MLSAAQRESFELRGLIQLPGWIDAGVAGTLRARVQASLEERKLVPDPVPPGFAVKPSLTQGVARALRFDELWGAPTLALLDTLLGAGTWQRPEHAGQILAITFPIPNATWSLPHKVWHLDYPAPGARHALPGVQIFVCLDRVEPRAGATVVACGTHRLIDALRRRRGARWPGRSADVRETLRREVPWLRELLSYREGEDRPARFPQVVELTGEPGDVWVMHPWLLHAPAPNCGARPRIVLTERIRSV